MKRKHLSLQLTERQQVLIGFVLVILVAISMLYCLGFASVALRQTWENSPLLWNQNNGYSEGGTELPGTPLAEPADSGAAPH